MIINGKSLLFQAPIKNMLTEKQTAHGVTHGLTECGVDIRIKQSIVFSQAGGKRVVYFTDESNVPEFSEGRFCLASSIEEFQMPNNLMAVVHDKSSWARQGLSVFNSCIEPGWNGFLTIELVYHGNGELIIPAGSGIAQVIFHDLTEPAKYTGKYQGQADRPVAAILV
jgi:dCTP deaminase